MRNKTSQAGFTLVEILVAIAVSSVVIISLNQVTNSYLHVSQTGRYMNLANSYIEAKVEALRNNGFNSLATGTTNLTSSLPTQLPPSRSASMTVTTPYEGIKQVSLTISYKDQGQTRVHNYTTYLGELGVGQ
jgi:prepilin-type N-terminal cleavage/methylation domain-containing protein